MKKMSIFGLLALLVLSIASVAQAADIKATGKWQIEAQWNNAQDFENLSQNKSFHIEQRIRTAFQFIANENLKGVLDTQIGSNSWGNGAFAVGSGRSPSAVAGGAAAAGSGNIMLRQGYIDFKWPGTKVNFKVGFQSLGLPAAFGGGSAILDDQIAAAVVSAPITDNIKILAGYARPTDANASGATGINASGTASDAVFAALPIDVKGFNITPFAMYMNAGANSGVIGLPGVASSGSNAIEGARGYWGGVAFTMTAFEPFKVMADLNYGKATYNNYTLADPGDGGRSGWLFDLAVDYTGLSMMTPEAFFVYTSGESGRNTDKSGRMPVVNNPQSWSVGSFFFGDRNFISGYPTNTTGGNTGGYIMRSMGFWTLGASLKDIKLIDKFSHTFTVLYAKGTNDSDYFTGTRVNALYGAMLTDKDHIWEVDFNTKYKIYDELSMYLDLGYINASMDKDTWRRANANYNNDDMLVKNAYKVGLGLAYAF